ncbi:MAG: hypothetical protein HQ463_03470 [Bacteroidetes bacterium]|nr:hypothetical protein [Bacteroidota bacterium]
MQGKVIYTHNIVMANAKETINLSAITSGNYFMVLNSNGVRYSQLFTILR